MKIKSLADDRDDFPKCEAKLSVETRAFWNGRGRPGNPKGKNYCDHFARYKIGRKHFCKKHAGLYVIENFTEIS